MVSLHPQKFSRVYKLVRNNGVLVSLSSPVDGQIEYPVGVWVRPLMFCGPLSAFESPGHAVEFIKAQTWGCTIELWEAEGEPYPENPVCFGALWTPTSTVVSAELPAGTVLCKQIRLKNQLRTFNT